jgi:hypothetical protein
MRILFDHGTPGPLIPFLEGHAVTKAKDLGWERLVNGELLKDAVSGETLRSAYTCYCEMGADRFVRYQAC